MSLHCLGCSARCIYMCMSAQQSVCLLCCFLYCCVLTSHYSFVHVGCCTAYYFMCSLQRSYYTPVAKRNGTVAGSAAAFTVSGLFHEFMFGTMLFWGAPQGVYRFGEVLVFFLLMFAMCCAPWWNTRKLTQVKLLVLSTVLLSTVPACVTSTSCLL
jgi:hypothetical protein